MGRAIDVLAVLMLLAAVSAFVLGIVSLGDREDFKAIYLLVIGALSLRASTEILRPRGGAA